MEEHKLFFQRGIRDDYWVEYSEKKDESGRFQVYPVKGSYLTIAEVLFVLGRNEGFPWDFFQVPVEVSFNADENDPVSESHKKAIESLVQQLHANCIEKKNTSRV
jgi:hypothetical protein